MTGGKQDAENNTDGMKSLTNVARREIKRIFTSPLYIFSMIGAPLLCFVFFVTLMGKGLPSELPVGVVDMDRTANSRNILRNLDAFQHVKIVARYRTFNEARAEIQRGKIYGVFYIPEGFSRDLQNQQQPTISYYSNYAYLIAGTLSFQDFKTMGELAAGAAARTVMRAKGMTDSQAQELLQPIVINKFPLGNPWINYSAYLNNTLLPAALMIIIFLVTVYSLGTELKEKTARRWLALADGSMFRALAGKLLPQTVAFFTIAAAYNLILYGVLHFPCHCGMPVMLTISFLFVLASQGLGVFFIGLLPNFRYAISIASLWGILSISMSGFTFPVTDMHPALKSLSVMFPLRHYFLVYVDQALNGYPLYYSWSEVMWLLVFVLLPLTVLHRLKGTLLTFKYEP